MLERQHRTKEVLVFAVRAKPHYMFDASPIVPASIEQDHLLRGRKVGRIPLEIPRRTVMLGWFAQGDNAGLARAQVLDDALDRAILSGGVPALEDDEHFVAVLDDVPLHLDEFDLQVVQRGTIDLSSTGPNFQALG
jgi:hypothetical protein